LQVNQLVAFQVVHDDVFMVGLPHFGVGADNRTGLRLYSVLPLSFVRKILLFLLFPWVGFVVDEPLRLFLILFLLDLLQNLDIVIVAVNSLKNYCSHIDRVVESHATLVQNDILRQDGFNQILLDKKLVKVGHNYILSIKADVFFIWIHHFRVILVVNEWRHLLLIKVEDLILGVRVCDIHERYRFFF